MRVAGWIAPALVLFLGSTARAAPAVGEKAPEISVDRWFNLPGDKKSIEPSDLKGKITVIEFWGTSSPASIDSIPHLIELQDKYRSKGVILLALSYEPERTVSDFLKKRKLPYVVGAGAEDTMTEYGVEGIPNTFLIGPDGKIAWSGHPAVLEPEIVKLIEESPARGKSFLVTGSAKSLFKSAETKFKKKKYEDALNLYEEVAADYAQTREGKEAKKKLKSMRGNSNIMGKIKRARSERKAERWLKAARALVQFGDPADAAKYYQRILKQCPDTTSAKLARTELESVKDADDSADDSSAKKSSKKAKGKKAAADEEEEESEDESEEEEDSDSEEESSDEEE